MSKEDGMVETVDEAFEIFASLSQEEKDEICRNMVAQLIPLFKKKKDRLYLKETNGQMKFVGMEKDI